MYVLCYNIFMKKKDPLQKVEEIVKNIHDKAGSYTQPVLHRYPLLFAFLIIFSVSAIMHGFSDIVSEVDFFVKHPGILMLIGIFILLFAGKLYRWLEKGSH